MSAKIKIHIPTTEEDAALTAAALDDPDNLPLTDEELGQFKPLRRRAGRISGSGSREVTVSMPIDPQVLIAFQSTGEGWQSLMSDALRAYVKEHGLLPGKR